MLARKKILKSAVISLLALIILTSSALAYSWDAPDTWFTYASQYPHNNYCGPASAWMYLTYARAKYNHGVLVPSQDTLYTYGHKMSISTDPDVDPRGEAWNLYTYTPGGYYYDDWVYGNAISGLKGGAWTVAYYQEPIIAATYHGSHFMVLRGVTADSDPYSNYPNATITNVYVADPWDNRLGNIFGSQGSLGSNDYIAASTWTGNYFTQFTYQYTVPAWTNKWVTIERDSTSGTPTTRTGSTLSAISSNQTTGDYSLDKGLPNEKTPLPPTDPKAGNAPPVVTPQYDYLDPVIAAKEQELTPITNNNDVISLANNSISILSLATKPGFDKALNNSVAGSPIFVNSIGPDFPDYYLVPFLQEGKTSAVVMIGIKNGRGYFMESTYTDNPIEEYPFISETKAKEISSQQLAGVDLTNAKVKFVWKPSQESMEPYYPFLEIQTDTNNFYIDHTGKVISQITEPYLVHN